MNAVNLIGRLTRDPETRSSSSGMAVCRFSIAIDRPGKEKQTDYPVITAFGKTAEICQQYLGKGSQVAIQGRIQTSSYEKDGRKVNTVGVVADRVEFLSRKEEPKEEQVDFAMLDEAVPF